MNKNLPNPSNDKLSDQERRFCVEYVIDRHVTHAAERAGYSVSNAAQQGCRLLRKAKVRKEVDRLLTEQAARIKFDGDRVMQELWKLGTVDIGQAYDDDGQLLAIKDMPEDVRRAISSVESEELFDGQGKEKTHIGFTKKIKFFDKPKSLELLGKHFTLFTEVVKHEGLDELAAKLEAARKRRQASHG